MSANRQGERRVITVHADDWEDLDIEVRRVRRDNASLFGKKAADWFIPGLFVVVILWSQFK
ncbi:hypothetical protein AB0O47_39770 [Streptomyces noursei]|uniref:hypothetical protein n=1 Tax=Streptomyces noursei TaxID=1971 RepID=UPI00344C1CE5